MNGTQNIPALEAARPGLRIVREVGVERIRAKSKRQTARIIELAGSRGWKINTPLDPDKRAGTVSIDMPNSQEVARELIQRNILVDWRPRAGIRMAPHFYNSDEEIETAFAAADEILRMQAVAR
jgi:kynureninase